ncbi:hypothetical protein FH972_026241 [Carpinus fangiana]|uniref:Uncharacterized protein n=1 Tax=Carpinus fangiana TaxID=176857 RepID=A0A5N6L3E0_9ROSI|nr:hypothetical protein FH972_026241 [Carpinus fangiana]
MQSFDLADTKQDFANAYSSTGFDMLSVLVRVATRPNPEINIGAVDLSCAFVVCDAHQHDFPIIYVSENFERLTGYTKHEILGRNCRFLQSPDGKVQSGVKRQYVDDESVGYLKTKIEQRKEAQVSLINYRKGGQPFMNLLTMIPVDFDGNETRYFVGFQVDLVEQPNSVTNKNKDGTYTVNYQRGLTMPKYTFNRPSEGVAMTPGQTVSRDDVSTVLTTISSGDSELTSRIWDKILLENTDDVVFVLSLKGLFLYLSPSSKAVLEYDSSELMGTALSSVCHPSDIVPVTRELKDTTSNTAVSVVFRVRRKESGYMWFEGHGSLHTEQGKGRKSIVLVGRERPVYSVSTSDISTSGGIGDNEVWTKLSTSGMFLFVSSNIRAMLDRTPTELVGTSIQTLMRSDSRSDFQRVLELARSGRRASAKHDLFNKRGQVLQAVSTVYPGDAAAGSKPTFFVAQTRLVKYTRPGATGRNAALSKLERQSGSMTGRATSSVGSQGRATSLASGRSSAGKTLPSPSQFMGTFEVAETHGGADGLPLGHQDDQLASEFNLFDELKTTRSTSWQFELRQMEKRNRLLAEELQGLLAARKKRKRRKGAGMVEKDCANCHTKQTPEWRRGPSGNRDLCNSCGLRWAKQQGRISPRTSSHRSAHSDGKQSGGSPAAAAAAPGGGDADAAARRKSIEETLADAKQQQKQQQEQPGPTDGSAQSSHTSKSQRLANAVNASPDTPLQPFGSVQGGVSIPTKIEETDESDAVG